MNNEMRLINRCQAGDNMAFSELYESHFNQIYRYIYFKTYHQETTEDLCSAVFIKAFTSIQSFNGGRKPFIAWLYTIAKNEISNHFRGNTEMLNIEEIWELQSGENVAMDAENRDNYMALQAHMRKLSPIERELIILRLWQELSFAEIASILSLKEGQCRMRFFRLVRKIREQMSGHLILLLLLHGNII